MYSGMHRRSIAALAILGAFAIGRSDVAFADEDDEPPDIGPIEDESPPPELTPEEPPDGTPPPTLDPKQAKRFLTAGDTLVKRGDYLAKRNRAVDSKDHYERALVAYQRAHELSNNDQVYFAIAIAEDKLGKTIDAIEHLQIVVAKVTDKPDLARRAQNKLDSLLQTVGMVTITVEPAGAALVLDGHAIGESPLAKPLILVPGVYVLAMSADGFEPSEVKLTIEAGSESERTFKLEAVPIVVEKPKAAPPPPPPPVPPPVPRTMLWVGAGGTIALIGIASLTGSLALGKQSDFEDAGLSQAERDDAASSGKTLALVTDLCLVGAAAAAAVTAYYYIKIYKPKARDREGKRKAAEAFHDEMSKLHVVPWVQQASAGLSVTGVLPF